MAYDFPLTKFVPLSPLISTNRNVSLFVFARATKSCRTSGHVPSCISRWSGGVAPPPLDDIRTAVLKASRPNDLRELARQ